MSETYENDAILHSLGMNTTQGHWVKLVLPEPIAEGHPFANYKVGFESGQIFKFRINLEPVPHT